MANSFSRTLILGASVSAAPVDRNPAKRFLKTKGALAHAMTHAQDGSPGASVLSRLQKSVLDQASAVIAVDLMFWDSVIGLSEPRTSQAYLAGLFNELRKRKLPVIIGRVPNFHSLQIHREEINAAIERETNSYDLATVLKLDRLFDSALKDQGVTINGRLHTIQELIPDGLHPGPMAAEFIAQEIQVLAEIFA